MSGNPPVDVQAYGQSIWYDNISRELLENKTIQRLVDDLGVVGMTSNPSIFEKAIAGSDIYDTAIGSMLDADVNTIFEGLAIDDIRDAADILRPVYDRTAGKDGFISLEVSPLIANDTATTISEAERLYALVERPNLMIKIPATDAGLPAIEETIAKGINVNVTLIFSVQRYMEVVEAFLQGLERRVKVGNDVSGIASVASFFLSRIDSVVDQQLESNIFAAQGRSIERVSANRKLLGTAAISNAKLAYRHYKSVFYGARFAALQQAGAQMQRPLWASTSTKNPAYPDTLYIDSLIGPDTVNTVPHDTLLAFADHGTVAPTLEQNLDGADDIMDMLAEVGVDMDMVTYDLLMDGVEKFAKSFENLMEAIEGKRKMLKAGVIKCQWGVMGAFERGIRDDIQQMGDAPRQIWSNNAEWWKKEQHHQDVIYNRLGWLNVFTNDRIDRQRLYILRGISEGSDWKHAVLLGMGGSSLAPEVLAKTFGVQEGFPELLVLDSTVPAAIQAIEKKIDLKDTVFIVASKSGTTTETSSFFDYFYQKAVDTVGAEQAGAHFIIITDPGSPLVQLGWSRQVSDIFDNPSDIGGRYSALSYFGLVPAAIMGLDLDRLYDSAERMLMALDPAVPAIKNPALWLGGVIGHIAQQGLDKLTILASPQISGFGNWVEQLVAESTGKEDEGVVPVVGATFGMPHDYDDDRLMVYLRLDSEKNDVDERVQSLWEAGHPVFTIELSDAYEIGGEFLRWEFATAVVGKMLGINPFDEPDVALAKKLTKDFLKTYEEKGALPIDEPIVTEDNVSLYAGERLGEILNSICLQRTYDSSNLEGMLAAHISLARSGNYIALLAYMEASDENEETLQTIRRRLRHATKRAVTLGYGPRYLHSTGQLHKGGPNNGVFIIITVDDSEDLDIPKQPYSFGILKQAQALGDLQALRDRKRRVVRVHISGDIQAGLEKISKAIEAAEAKII
jgi:transaldolase/glucose-6-phosphate isomerase